MFWSAGDKSVEASTDLNAANCSTEGIVPVNMPLLGETSLEEYPSIPKRIKYMVSTMSTTNIKTSFLFICSNTYKSFTPSSVKGLLCLSLKRFKSSSSPRSNVV